MPTIPLDPIDVLVVGSIGKDISGAGINPNVVGMHRRLGGPPEREIRRIVALTLPPRSEGNAIGVGIADIITDELRSQIHWESTYINALTSDFLWGINLPISFSTDREAIAAALRPYPQDHARAVFIQDTSHLETIYVTPAFLQEVHELSTLEIVEESVPLPLTFDEEGRLALTF